MPATHPPVLIDLTMEDDDSSTTITTRDHMISPHIKAEPGSEPINAGDQLESTEIDPLPDLPPSPLEDAQSNALDAGFEQNLATMLSEYNANSRMDRAPSLDRDYEEARAAFELKQGEVATRESLGEEVSTVRIELKGLEDSLHRAERRRKKIQANTERQTEANSMFFTAADPSDEELIAMTRPPTFGEAMNKSRERSQIEISEDERRPPQRPSRGRAAQSGRDQSKRKTPATKGKTKITKRAQPARRGGRQGGGMLNMGSLIRNDVVGDAMANQGLREQPGFDGKRNKKDALNALIASIPKEQQDTAYGMRTNLNNACKQFRWRGPGSMRPDGHNGWKLKGMSSSLKHFQLQSAAWGVGRENGATAPFGGILADTMGYGKTVQMITIMVENQPKADSINRTTLIIVPASIVDQWAEEIVKHTDEGILDDVFIYRSGSRVSGPDICRTLRRFRVVITTYHEVMRNYPKCEPPAHLVTEKSKDIWWERYYNENCGPLLRMPFFRIILDEAHAIKNHESRTSKACRLLTAKYRWVLTGTPLSNCMEELFPYFNFLGVEGSATYTQFKHNYGKRNDITMQRLDAILRSVMIRRTGSDRLFGAPLVSLPALDHQTISLPFNKVERAIYSVVRQRFIERINDWSNSGTIQKLSRNIFVMLLRLRQMCAHVLMVTTTIRDLLETEDVEKLWRVSERHSMGTANNTITKTANVLRRILKEARDEKKEADTTPVPDLRSQETTTVDLTIDDSDFDYRGLFYKLQNDGAWEKIRNRSTCCQCNKVPAADDAKLAVPCNHYYCGPCITALLESALQSDTEATCTSCQNSISGAADIRAMEQIAAEANQRDPFRASSSDGTSRKGKGRNDPDLKWLSIPDCEKLSTKIQAVTYTMQEWINNDPDAKIVVFTLFIPVIKVLGKVCSKRGWGYQEFTGQVSAEARNRNLNKWKDPEQGHQVLLMSMRAGGLGLNLVKASYVIIVDPWWNEPAEDQAFSRVYRIGQRKDCVVRRFVITDAVDTQLMHHLQRLKAQECDRVIDGRSNADLSIPGLLRLFGPTKRDPRSGEIIIDGDDGTDEFIQSDDEVIVDDSETEELMPAPARPREN